MTATVLSDALHEMPPDLNSLPSSRPSSIPLHHTRTTSLDHQPPSPGAPSPPSFQPTATILATPYRSAASVSPSRRPTGRRRRSSLHLTNSSRWPDPTTHSPGDLRTSPRLARASMALPTADPNHHAPASLGELHQELENEQELQVNRLLALIREQQSNIASLQRSQGMPPDPPSSLLQEDDSVFAGPMSERNFYQAETQTLIRENQMLKLRIHELESQITQLNAQSPSSHERPLVDDQSVQSPLPLPDS